jgi:hypothetical protein
MPSARYGPSRLPAPDGTSYSLSLSHSIAASAGSARLLSSEMTAHSKAPTTPEASTVTPPLSTLPGPSGRPPVDEDEPPALLPRFRPFS